MPQGPSSTSLGAHAQLALREIRRVIVDRGARNRRDRPASGALYVGSALRNQCKWYRRTPAPCQRGRDPVACRLHSPTLPHNRHYINNNSVNTDNENGAYILLNVHPDGLYKSLQDHNTGGYMEYFIKLFQSDLY